MIKQDENYDRKSLVVEKIKDCTHPVHHKYAMLITKGLNINQYMEP